ncbi:MAG: DUF427 domain-containing protein [Bacteroidetes bacterium]|nr:DUF427 domain-containing protein [Bacteroidota bacterium]
MAKAIWNGKIIAESNEYEIVERNIYFPAQSVKKEFLRSSDMHTVCPWKGTANYYDVVVDGQVNKDAAWYYESPSDAASNIKGHIAFWKGVKIEE